VVTSRNQVTLFSRLQYQYSKTTARGQFDAAPDTQSGASSLVAENGVREKHLRGSKRK